jgi:hypothetical protein
LKLLHREKINIKKTVSRGVSMLMVYNEIGERKPETDIQINRETNTWTVGKADTRKIDR